MSNDLNGNVANKCRDLEGIFQAKGHSSTKALRWEEPWPAGATERRPVWLEHDFFRNNSSGRGVRARGRSYRAF